MIYVVALDQSIAHRWIDKNLGCEKYKVVTSPWHLVGIQAEPEDILYKVGRMGINEERHRIKHSYHPWEV